MEDKYVEARDNSVNVENAQTCDTITERSEVLFLMGTQKFFFVPRS